MSIRSKMASVMMLLVVFALNLSAQKSSVTGVVMAEGETLPGASIVVKGTTVGVMTDLDGKFTISASAGDLISISFMGYSTKEVIADLSNVMTINLEVDQQMLGDVIVVGYGSVKKSDLTGSVASINMDDIPAKPANSIDGLLQGRTAGVQVVSTSDDPGAGATVRIRGGSSLRAGNDPLVVVDGFPIGTAGDIKQISPSDIASIEVLKDASSAAIYGSKGANGVIMITTKKGKKNSTEVSINQQLTVSQFTSELDLWRDLALMAELSNEGRTNGGFTPIYIGAEDATGTYYPSVQELRSGSWEHNTAWDDVVFRDPISENLNLAVRTQTDKTQFSASTTYYQDQGVYIEDDYSKININLNVNQEVYEGVKVGANAILTKGDRNNNGGLAYWRNPIFPVYDENGDYFLINDTDYSHPVALTEKRLNKTESMDFIGSGILDIQLIPSLNLKTQINYKYGKSITDTYDPTIYTENGTYNNGAGSIYNWEDNDLVSETYLTYDNNFGAHKLSVVAGYSYQYYETRYSQLKAYDFVNETLLNENLSSGNPEKQEVYNGLSENVMISYLGRTNYVYNDKYLATLTFRSDGSSKFGANNQWAMFPSTALGWKMHEESFVQDLNTFDELKLRASYGVSGNQEIPGYLTNSKYGQSKYYDGGDWKTGIGPGYVVGSNSRGENEWGGIPNPDIKWETTSQFNIGADMAFFDRKLRVTLDYYNKYTTDLLRERYLAPTSGYDKMWVNDGEVRNSGIEITIDGDIINTDDWSVSGALMFSKNSNEIVDLGDEKSSGVSTDFLTGMNYEFTGSYIESFRGYPNVLAEGEAVNAFYGYTVDGIVQSEAEGLAAGLTGDLAKPGEYKYVDISGDGEIDEDDRSIIGDPNPDFIASLNLQVRYKKFDMSMFFNGSFGYDVLNTQAFNQPSNQPLRWTMDNPTDLYPSLRDGRNILMSDWHLEEASYLRLQNLAIGYNFEEGQIPFIKRGRLYLNGTNLFTLTNFDGYDPEVSGDGIYWGGYPKLRRWTFGIEVTI